jgi:co-chaperonin GroES (HSP10)
VSDLDNWIVYAEHNGVAAEIIDWEDIFGDGNALQFSRDVKIHAPAATIGRRDRTIVLHVKCVGPGNVSRGTLNQCTIKSGDYVVANLLHQAQDLSMLGESVKVFPWEHIMAKLNIDELTKSVGLQPLQCYLVCKPNERLAHKVIMGESKIIAPFGDAQLSGGVEPEPTFDRMGNQKKMPEKNKTVVEQVVAVGPGAVVDGMWQEPRQELVGGLVLYDTSVAAVRFVLGGQQYSLVHWRHVVFSILPPEDQRAAEAGATIQ